MDSSSWMGFLELLIVLGFALGWAVLELVGLKLDRKRRQAAELKAGDRSRSGSEAGTS